MRVTCTNCSAVFNLPDEKLEGRTGSVKVRCPRCDTIVDLALEAPAEAEEPVWYYSHGDAQEGPVTEGTLRGMVADGSLSAEDLVWRAGMEDWAFVQDVPTLLESEDVEAAPPPTVEDAGADAPPEGEDASAEDIADRLAAEMAEEDAERADEAPDEAGESAEETSGEALDDEPDWAEESRDLLSEISREEGLATRAISEAVPISEEPAAEEPEEIEEPVAEEPEEPVAEEPEEPVAEEPEEIEEPVAEEPEEHEEIDEPVAEEPEEADALAEAKSLLARVEELDGDSEPAPEPDVVEEEEDQPSQGPAAPDAGVGSDNDDNDGEGHGGLFAQFDSGDPAPTEPDASASDGDGLLHTRRETSVLFSLDDLTGDGTAKSPDEGLKAGDSGLIDIRTIALGTGDEDEDVFGAFGAGDARMLSDVGAAAVALPLVKRRKRWPIFLAAGIVVLIGLGVGGFLGKDHLFPGVNFLGQVVPDAMAGVKAWQAKRIEDLQVTYTAKMETAQEEGSEAIKAAQRALDARYEQAMVAAQSDLVAHRKVWDARLATLEGEVKVLETRRTEKLAAEKARAEAEAAEKARLLEESRKADEAAKKVEDDARKAEEAARTERKTERATERKAERKVEKKVEKKVEAAKTEVKKVEEKKADGGTKTDAAALLAAIDKKADGGGGDDAEKSKVSKKTLTLSDITRVVRQNKGNMTGCFNKYGSGLSSARISTRVTIEGSGSVSSVTIATREYAGTALGNCVKKVIQKMKFPEFSGKPVKKPIAVSLP